MVRFLFTSIKDKEQDLVKKTELPITSSLDKSVHYLVTFQHALSKQQTI